MEAITDYAIPTLLHQNHRSFRIAPTSPLLPELKSTTEAHPKIDTRHNPIQKMTVTAVEKQDTRKPPGHHHRHKQSRVVISEGMDKAPTDSFQSTAIFYCHTGGPSLLPD